MNRRTLLKRGGMALLGLGAAGCASTQAARPTPAVAGPGPGRAPTGRLRVNLVPVEASWDRVIRTTVGLRPHRASGFVLRAEKLDAKTLIHNYGHGGAGHSLGWGTGAMAADLALEQGDRRAAVIGCGTVGLTAARQLQRRGFDVTIYTMTVPPDTTSNMALAGFTPTSGLISGTRTPEWDAQFLRAVDIAYRQLQLLAGPTYGISWLDSYSFSDTPPDAEGSNRGGGGGVNSLLPAALRTGREVLGPGEHPFPWRFAIRQPGMRIEPSIYLDALLRDFVLFGGRVVVRRFDQPRDLMSLGESLIVNCSGLGSRTLFGDEEMTPVKGQLTLLVPQSDVTYQTFGGGPPGDEPEPGGLGIHMMPRSDGIALGGTAERGISTLEPNDAARTRIVEGHIHLFSGMRPPASGGPVTRLDGRSAIPHVESFFGLDS